MNRAFLNAVWILPLALCLAPAAAARTLHVMPWGAGTACTDVFPCELQYALDTAADNGVDDTVILHEGGYTPSSPPYVYMAAVSENRALVITRAPHLNLDQVALTGDNNVPVLRLDQSPGGVYDQAHYTVRGLTIRNGKGTAPGAGLAVVTHGGSITVEKCDIYANSSSGLGSGLYLWSDTGDIRLLDTDIHHNHGAGGGAWMATLGTVTVTGNRFIWNQANLSGGGLHAVTSNALFENNIFFQNSAGTGQMGGGARVEHLTSGGTVSFTNNVFSGNWTGWLGGGLALANTGVAGTLEVKLNFNTFTKNGTSATVSSGGGVWLHGPAGSFFLLADNIIHGNEAAEGGDIRLDGPFESQFSGNDYSSLSGIPTYASSNVDLAPGLVTPDGFDFHLRAGSAVIDKGVIVFGATPLHDADGGDRVSCPTTCSPDMGAYEYQHADVMTLVAPVGGEVLPAGASHTVRWKAPPGVARTRVSYSLDDGATWTRYPRTTAGTTLLWDLPVPAGNQNRCRLKVTGLDAGGAVAGEAVTATPFTLQVIGTVTPGTGEVIKTARKHYRVTWRVNRYLGVVDHTDVLLTTNGGSTWLKKAGLTGLGFSAVITIPSVPLPRTRCRVRVVLKDAAGKTLAFARTPGYFTIEP